MIADGADAVVVLGAKLQAPGTPGPALKRRLAHAVAVFQQNDVPFLVLSGGIVGPPPAEGEVMGDLAIGMGVPAERIIVEDRSVNTFQNAVYTGRIARDRRWDRLVLVTDSYHMPRALYVFRRLGLNVSGAPVPRQPGMSRSAWFAAQMREAAAFAHSWLLFLIGRHKAVVDAVWGR